MRLYSIAISALLLLGAASMPASSTHAQGGFVVVVNSGNPVDSIERRKLSRLFLRQTRRWDHGANAEPVDLPPGAAARDAFSQAVHRRSATSVISFWRQQIFSGRSVPPPERASGSAVISYVSSHRGGLGYVAPGTNTSRVKVITIE